MAGARYALGRMTAEPDTSLPSQVTAEQSPARWAAVGLFGGVALVALVWAMLGRGGPLSGGSAGSGGDRSANPQLSAPAPAPIIVVNVPPPPLAPESVPGPDAPSQGPAAPAPVNLGPPTPPAITVSAPAPSTPDSGKPPGKRLNLNAATVEELDLLPGVGKATAQAIIDYRTKHGRFRTISELDKVPGIGPAKLERLRPLVSVD